MCKGKSPTLKMVRGYFATDCQDLQWWCWRNRGCDWLTGIGIVEAAQRLVEESISNGNK